MAMIKFASSEVGEATSDFALLPVGKYVGLLANHEWKKTKSGGHLLALTWEITDGPEGVGRKVFDNLNLDCANEEAQKIALRSYKSICLVCNAEKFYEGIFEIDGDDAEAYFDALSTELYGHNVGLNIGIEKSKDPAYSDKNKIKSYIAPSQMTSAAVSNSSAKKPFWAKPK